MNHYATTVSPANVADHNDLLAEGLATMLSVDEIRRLVTAAAVGPEREGMSGPERALLYQLAIETGLRANELRSLSCWSFDLDGAEPSVMVKAGYSKRRRDDTLPLRPGLADALQKHFSGKLPDAPAFAMPRPNRLVFMLRADLEAARRAWIDEAVTADEREQRRRSSFLAYRDEANRVVDFHALRHTTGSLLAASGVHPKTAQSLMRHSTIALTMDRYTHTLRGADRAAIATLPSLDPEDRARQQRTGTDDRALVSEDPAARLALCLARDRSCQPKTVRPDAAEAAGASPAKEPRQTGNNADGPAKAVRAAGNTGRAAQAEVGFEPTNNGFAIRPLRPLGYSAATRKNNPLS